MASDLPDRYHMSRFFYRLAPIVMHFKMKRVHALDPKREREEIMARMGVLRIQQLAWRNLPRNHDFLLEGVAADTARAACRGGARGTYSLACERLQVTEVIDSSQSEVDSSQPRARKY